MVKGVVKPSTKSHRAPDLRGPTNFLIETIQSIDKGNKWIRLSTSIQYFFVSSFNLCFTTKIVLFSETRFRGGQYYYFLAGIKRQWILT